MIIHALSATVTMADVRTHGARGVVIEVGNGSTLRAVNCAFSEFVFPFCLTESTATFEDCDWLYSERSAGPIAGTIYESMNPALRPPCPTDVRQGHIINGNITFNRCKFQSGIAQSGYDPTTGQVSVFTAISSCARAKLALTACTISGFDTAIELQDSFTEAVVKSSKIMECGLAFHAELNSEVVVTDCDLIVNEVLQLTVNVKGKAIFEGNSVQQSTRQFVNLGLITLDKHQRGKASSF